MCFPCFYLCVFTSLCFTIHRLPFYPSFSAGPRYGCSSLRWSGGGPAAVCDTGVVRGSARISPQMPPSPRRHHRFFVCSHCCLPPWQLQASQTGWVLAHTHTHILTHKLTHMPSHTHTHQSVYIHTQFHFYSLCLFSQLSSSFTHVH